LAYKPIANQLGVQVSDVSFYMSIVYLCEVIFSPIVGVLLEKFDVRIICTLAGVCVTGAFFAMSTFTVIWQWYIAAIFIGFSQITLLWLMTAGVLGRWFKKKLGFALGLSYAMTGAGGAVLNIVGQFVLGANLLVEDTWRDLYFLFGCLCAVGTIPWTALCLRNAPEDVGLKAYGAPIAEGEVIDEEDIHLSGIEPKKAYTSWYFYVLIIAGCLMNICGIYPQHYTNYYQSLVAVYPGTETAIPELMIMSGTLEAFSMVGMMIGKILTGIIESKSVQAALIVGIVTGIAGISCIWFGGYNKILPILFGGGLIYGFIYAFVTTLLPYLTRQIFGDLHYDKIYSVILIPVNLVGATAASGLALINQTFGWDVFFTLDIVVMLLIYAFCTIAYKAGKKAYADKAVTS
jgi:MFS family permease